jgi:undecaprenyl-diphosphatase
MIIRRKHVPLIIIFILSLLLVGIILIHDHAYLSRFDHDVIYYFNKNRIRSLDRTFQFITDINTTVTFITIASVLLLSFLKRSKVILFKAIAIASAMITTTILTSALKELINRDRPFITYPSIERLTTVITPSFPSGHTSEAFALATIVSLLFPDIRVIVVAYIWAILIAYSRMVLGVHYPTDLISAVLLGATVSILIWLVFATRTRPLRTD